MVLITQRSLWGIKGRSIGILFCLIQHAIHSITISNMASGHETASMSSRHNERRFRFCSSMKDLSPRRGKNNGAVAFVGQVKRGGSRLFHLGKADHRDTRHTFP